MRTQRLPKLPKLRLLISSILEIPLNSSPLPTVPPFPRAQPALLLTRHDPGRRAALANTITIAPPPNAFPVGGVSEMPPPARFPRLVAAAALASLMLAGLLSLYLARPIVWLIEDHLRGAWSVTAAVPGRPPPPVQRGGGLASGFLRGIYVARARACIHALDERGDRQL